MRPPSSARLRRALLVPAAAIVAGACWLGNFTVGTSVIPVVSPELPAPFEGFRIVQLSDLHGRRFGPDSARLIEAVREAGPDLIALTGDLADRFTDLSVLPPLLRALTELAPVFYVTGNHEWSMRAARRRALYALLDRAGVVRLENTFRVLRRGEARLVVAGVDDPNGPIDQKHPQALVREIRAAFGADAYIVMLAHRNDRLPVWSACGVQLVLTGHAHGGIVRLPGVGAVFGTHMDLFPEHTSGLYRAGRTAMIVSRGLGGSRKLPIRINNRPEVVVAVLTRGPEI